MKTVRYACTHCGRRFEAEEKDIVECPGCFWSTSVKRAEDVEEAPHFTPDDKPRKSFTLPSIPWKPLLNALAAVFLIFVIIKFGIPFFKKAKSASPKPSPSTSAKPNDGKQNAAVSPAPGVSAPAQGISAEDQAVLDKRVTVSAEREPSPEEQKVLSNRAQFKTGFTEKLPSQVWTVDNFKEMLNQQQQFYKVPLPRSYRNKLIEHFEKNYLPGAEAFKAGDLIRARDAWVASLAVPLYSTNIQKHRGVVLTMIRPFITDTLSKIGSINSAAVEKEIRTREEKIISGYSQVLSSIDKKDWSAALAALDQVNEEISHMDQPQKVAAGPAPYPPAIAQVDPDIQAALQGMLTVPPPAISDFEPLSQDLFAKKKVIESFIPETLKKRTDAYQEACAKIDAKDWAGAEAKLKEVELPLDLMRDASEKIRVLRKIQK